VVCTDAHGNRDFCRDGENCLMPEARRDAVAQALTALLTDPVLRERIGRAGLETAAQYAWPRRIDALEAFLNDLAVPSREVPFTGAVPQLRRASVG
jgi:glycosyltransferase involved in cell wall biosynthesis